MIVLLHCAGSGKSLALLCSVLAWQQTEKERILLNQKETVDEECLNCTCDKNVKKKEISSVSTNPTSAEEIEQGNDFKCPSMKMRTPLNKVQTPIKIEYEKTIDTIDDMLQSEMPLMIASDTIFPMLLETDPRKKVKALSEKIELFVYGTGTDGIGEG